MEDNYVLHLELGKLPRYISYINAKVMNGVMAIRRLMTWKIKVCVCLKSPDLSSPFHFANKSSKVTASGLLRKYAGVSFET